MAGSVEVLDSLEPSKARVRAQSEDPAFLLAFSIVNTGVSHTPYFMALSSTRGAATLSAYSQG